MGITRDQVRELFTEIDGKLIRRTNVANQKTIGVTAGCYTESHPKVKINDVPYGINRVVFLYHHGYLPDCVINIDGNLHNNKIENLKPAEFAEKSWTSKMLNKTKSGVKGVTLIASTGKWQARVMRNGKRLSVCGFNTIDEASAMAESMRDNLHNEFACHG